MLTIDRSVSLSFEEYQSELQKAEKFHGHLCPGMYNGVKMSQLARVLLGYTSLPTKDLIVVVEIDRCLTDAISSFTGARLGRRTLKFRDYGKFAATFCSLARKQGIRLAQLESAFAALEAEMQAKGVDKHHPDAPRIFFDYPGRSSSAPPSSTSPSMKTTCPAFRENVTPARSATNPSWMADT